MCRNRKVCKYELAFKAFQLKTNVVAEFANNNKGNKLWQISKTNVVAESANNNKGNKLLQIAGGVTKAQRMNLDEKRRKEKAETLLHLICWGPN